MNDDSLYGWIAPGQSKPFPAGMTFSYTSDRPDVVSVDAGGTIHTGRERRGDDHRDRDLQRRERVDVSSSCACSPTSTDLKVDGKPVRGFLPDVFDLRRDRSRPASPTSARDRHGAAPARCASRRPRACRARRRHLDRARTASSRPTRSTSPGAATSDEFDGADARPEVDGRAAEPRTSPSAAAR